MRFQKGRSGNPGGRPAVVKEVRELARKHVADAVATLYSIMMDEKADPRARVSACKEVLDRGYGKAPQSLDIKAETLTHVEFEQLDDAALISRATAMFGGNSPSPN